MKEKRECRITRGNTSDYLAFVNELMCKGITFTFSTEYHNERVITTMLSDDEIEYLKKKFNIAVKSDLTLSEYEQKTREILNDVEDKSFYFEYGSLDIFAESMMGDISLEHVKRVYLNEVDELLYDYEDDYYERTDCDVSQLEESEQLKLYKAICEGD